MRGICHCEHVVAWYGAVWKIVDVNITKCEQTLALSEYNSETEAGILHAHRNITLLLVLILLAR